MTPKNISAIAIYVALCLTCVVPSARAADKVAPYATWTLHYSGKHSLVWYYSDKKGYQKNEPARVVVDDIEFSIYPGVSPPSVNGIYLLDYAHVNDGEEVLDIGTGSGLHAIFAAKQAKHVVATDIDPNAVANAEFNATRLGLEKKIDFRAGDLFAPIKDGEKFDVIFININFPFSKDPSVRATLHERFFSEARQYLKPSARIYFQTGLIKNFPRIYDLLQRNNFRIMEMHMENMPQYHYEPMFMMIQDDVK